MMITRLVMLLHLNCGDWPLLFLTQIPIRLGIKMWIKTRFKKKRKPIWCVWYLAPRRTSLPASSLARKHSCEKSKIFGPFVQFMGNVLVYTVHVQLYWRPSENIGKPSWPVHNPRAAVLPLCSRFLQAVGQFLQQDKIYNASVEKVVIMFWRWPAKLACWATTGSVRAPSRSCVKIVCSANAPFENIY